MDSATITTVEQISGAVLIGAMQGYNMWAHRQNVLANLQTAQLVKLTYGDVETELNTIRQSVENLQIKLNGGDRRAPRASVAENLAAAQGNARRWKDFPNAGQPAPAPEGTT